MGIHAAPNYKKPHPSVVTIRISKYPATTFGKCIKKWRLEQGLLQVDMGKMIGVDEMTIVNWEKDKTTPTRENYLKLKEIMPDLEP